jgi:ribosomal protein L14E/L6E/L27E
LLSGRFAGRKAVVVKATDDGNNDKRFGHAIGEMLESHLLNNNGSDSTI